MNINVVAACVGLIACYFLAMIIHDIYWDLYDIITGEDTRHNKTK